MDRLACVDLPALALQLLLRRNSQWSGRAVAVVREDKPQGCILHVNERARHHGVLPGMRYAAGLSLAPGLCAGAVSSAELQEAVSTLVTTLRSFSPHIESCTDEPGVFWVDARGLSRLWPSLSKWGAAVADKLRADGWVASVVVGFSRFSTYAIARSQLRDPRRLLVLGDKEAERRLCVTVALDRLRMDSKSRDGLARLGVTTVGELLALSSAGVRRRFGPGTERLWRLAAGDRNPKMRPQAALDPARAVAHLDHGTSNSSALLFLIKRALPGALSILAQRREVLARLHIHLLLDGGARREEALRPAAATLDEQVILDLVRLRLDRLELPARVVDIELWAEGEPATSAQLQMYFERPRRDLAAAQAALARLRAELGDDAVLVAERRDGHLPEARFRWAPLDKLPDRAARPRAKTADVQPGRPRPLVRRLLAAPRPLPPQSRHVRNDGWLISGLRYGSVVRSTGSYLVSGGWWRKEIHREYQFAETQRGDILWVFYDRQRRRWFLHGLVM